MPTKRLFAVEGARVGSRLGVEVFQDGSSNTAHLKDLDVLHDTFATPDLTTFCRLDELGLEAAGQRLDPDRAMIECRVIESVLAPFEY